MLRRSGWSTWRAAGRGGPGPPENVRVDKASVISDVRAAGLRIVDEDGRVIDRSELEPRPPEAAEDEERPSDEDAAPAEETAE